MTSTSPIRFRPVDAGDHGTFVRLFAELGVDDPPPDLRRFLAVIAPSAFFAVDEAERVLAYAFYELLETDGYVRHVVVDGPARGRGVGRAVMDELARRFREAGCARWRLNVKPDNAAARSLYESVGMRPAYAARVLRIAWAVREALPGAARGARELDAAEIDAFERALDIPRRLLGNLAARGFSPLGVRDGLGTPIAASAHDPTFPGSFPFRARTLEAARALLDASFAKRVSIVDPARPWREVGAQIVVEDDDGLADRLVAAGAEEVLVTLHHVGVL